MFSELNSVIRNWMILALAGLMISWTLFISQSWAQTTVSGKVITSDGMVVSSGAVALEQGELHNNAFLVGGAIGSDGTFKIPLPSGGPWGLHVYSEKYIYFPLQIQVTAGADNEIPVILPVDGTTADDPRISNIQFKKLSDQVFQVAMQVDDPNNNLGPQMLAVDAKAALSGEKLFAANCSACHFPDRKDKKVGPGLKGLFSGPKLPDSGLPATDANVRQRIINGGDKMPPFKHLKEEELKSIVEYLKTL